MATHNETIDGKQNAVPLIKLGAADSACMLDGPVGYLNRRSKIAKSRQAITRTETAASDVLPEVARRQNSTSDSAKISRSRRAGMQTLYRASANISTLVVPSALLIVFVYIRTTSPAALVMKIIAQSADAPYDA